MATSEPGPQVKIVVGDVFESSNANILIIPCSTTGSMGGAFRKGIEALGVTEIPEQLKAGQVATIPVTHGRSSIGMVLLAAVVDPREKSPEAAIRRVEEATRRAGEVASTKDSVVATPLLATGAAGLDPEPAAQAMLAGFSASAHPSAQMWIYVLSRGVHDQVEASLSRHLAHHEQAPASPAIPLHPGPREILALASAIASVRGAREATGLDVILACMVRPDHTSLGKNELAHGATGAMVGAIPPPAPKRIADALSSAGAGSLPAGLAPTVSPDDPRLAQVLEAASAVVRELGSGEIWSHHLVGAALIGEQIPAGVLAALGVSQQDLRRALLSGIAKRWPAEATTFWTQRLASPLSAGRTRLVADRPALADELGRLCLAHEVANLLRELASNANQSAAFGDPSVAFAVHLDARWGAGKTTLVNFVIEDLQKPSPERREGVARTREPWTIVKLDAWRSSQLSPAWWALLTHLRKGVRGSLGRWRRLMVDLRFFWRSVLQYWLLWVPPITVLVILGVLWFRQADIGKLMTGVAAAIALAVSIGGLVGRFFSLGSIQSARLHERLSSNPMEEVAMRTWAIQQRSRRNILLVVDDLDRCSDAFTVELLDAIQTLLRNPPTGRRAVSDSNQRPTVLVVFAVGDGRWLRAAYENRYSTFSPYVNEAGRPLGNLFLDKLFQVRVEVPDPSPAQMSSYLATLLEVKAEDRAPQRDIHAIEVSISDALEQRGQGAFSLDNRLSEIMTEASDLNPLQRRDVAGMALEARRSDPHRREREQHMLQQYTEMIEPNPRAAKRFIMAYNIAFASRLLDPESIPAETLALWTLIAVRWPALAEWIRGELPDGSLEPIDLEHHPSKLLVAPQVQRVIASKNGGPLDRDMFLRCCGYPVPAARTPEAPPKEAGERPDARTGRPRSRVSPP
jgi:hypothetical protein